MVPLSLTARALRLLARREHTRAELVRKLGPYEEEAGALQRVLDSLQAKGYIDEARVAESVLHRRAGGRGVARLQQELRAKGLDAQQVAQALTPLRDTELARARALWCKKFGTPAITAQERARQMRFLAGRGFGGETIRHVIAGDCED